MSSEREETEETEDEFSPLEAEEEQRDEAGEHQRDEEHGVEPQLHVCTCTQTSVITV